MSRSAPILSRLLELLDGFSRVRVLSIVDLVADEYIYGDISRVSREAPVLILDYDRAQLVPGGGANAVNNIASLGGQPLAVGMVGKDASGRELLSLMRKARIDISGIRKDPNYQTPTKTRILAGRVHATKQQVVRIDRLTHVEHKRETRAHLDQAIRERLLEADVVMVSDYGYGLVSPSYGSALARKTASLQKKAILDSRSSIQHYSHFASATPNEPELEAALGIHIGTDLSLLEKSGRELLRRLRADSLLVTRGKDGMALFEPRRPVRHVPIYGTDEVADVTGAGDTVIGTYSLALGAGASYFEASLLANYAGGIVVTKRGTATVSRNELEAAIRSEHGHL